MIDSLHGCMQVYYIQAKKQRNHEVHPTRISEIWGWRGGKVEDFEFETSSGMLKNGFVVVGPHPLTDVNDIVRYGDKRYGVYGYGYTGPTPASGLADNNNYTRGDGSPLLFDHSPFSDLEVRSPGPELR